MACKHKAGKRKNGRERARRFYERLEAGRIVVPLEIEHENVVVALIRRGLLREQDRDDRRAIGRALSSLVLFGMNALETDDSSLS